MQIGLYSIDFLLAALFSFLDFESRVALNSALRAESRIGTPLDNQGVASFQLVFAGAMLARGLNYVQAQIGLRRKRALLELLSHTFPNNWIYVERNPRLLEALKKKLEFWRDPSCSEYATCSTSFQNDMIHACTLLLARCVKTR
jgi:hypothetical protein